MKSENVKNNNISNVGRLKFDDKYQDKIEQNQKIVDVLLSTYKKHISFRDITTTSIINSIIKEATGKDIKDIV